jgi:hypothetical protein
MSEPDPALKGKKDGNCNRQACQQPGATYFNVGTDAYYCESCARRINRDMTESDKLTCRTAFGVPVLCLPAYLQYAGLDDIAVRKAVAVAMADTTVAKIVSTAAGQRVNTGFMLPADDVRYVLALVTADGHVWTRASPTT